MGLCGAPSTFQYLMDDVFRIPLEVGGALVPHWKFLAVYLDDICIFSSSLEEHVLHLRAVLVRLRERQLYVKPTKCAWAQTEVEFLGHFVSSSGMRVHPEKAKALQDWPAPTTVHELRSCLGTFNYWRGYIHKYSNIVAPLVALTRKNVVWRWRDDVEGHALQTFKRAVLDSPVLLSPNPDKPYLLSLMRQIMLLGLVSSRKKGGKGVDEGL